MVDEFDEFDDMDEDNELLLSHFDLGKVQVHHYVCAYIPGSI